MRIVVASVAFGAHGGSMGGRMGPAGNDCEIDVRARRGIVSRMRETKTLAHAVADRHPHVQDRGRPDLNSSFASFQSPSDDFAIPLI
jgi:hypothetical protein